VDSYVAGIVAFGQQPRDPTAVQNLLESRRVFVDVFPFCSDELSNEAMEARASAEDYMVGIYGRSPEAQASLLSTLREYREIVAELRHVLRPT
jgi:hypothetical protein